MRWSLPMGRLFGIPIKAHASLLVVLLALGLFAADTRHQLVYGATIVGLLAGSVLLHELGHALLARRYGVDTQEILLLPIGGMARLTSLPRFPAHEMWIALAGPATSLGLAAASWGLYALFGSLFLAHAAVMNLILGVFNLLPAFPLDGGRVLRAALTRRMGALRATRRAATVGRFLAAGLLVGSILLADLMLGAIAVFVWFAAGAEEKSGVARALLDGRRAGDMMLPIGCTVPATADPAEVLAELRADGDRRAIPVIFGARVMGVVHREPLLSAVAAGFEPHFLHQILDRNIVTTRAETPLRDLLGLMGAGQSRAAVVMDDDGVRGILLMDSVVEQLRQGALRPPRPSGLSGAG
ncbi:MAG: site-2 protease family protein [Myxococcota bacterium]